MENHSIIFSNFMVSLKTKISIISLIFYFLSLFIDFNRNILEKASIQARRSIFISKDVFKNDVKQTAPWHLTS